MFLRTAACALGVLFPMSHRARAPFFLLHNSAVPGTPGLVPSRGLYVQRQVAHVDELSGTLKASRLPVFLAAASQ